MNNEGTRSAPIAIVNEDTLISGRQAANCFIDNFEDNGFNRKHLQKIARDYRPREFNQQLDSSSFIYRLPPGPPPHPPP